MITITEGLYAHRAGATLIISDQKQLPRPIRLQGKVLLMADDLPGTKRLFKRWLSNHQLDEITAALNITRSTAHRLRAAMGISKRASYNK